MPHLRPSNRSEIQVVLEAARVTAPTPIAEAVSDFQRSTNLHQQRDRLVEVHRVVLRLLATIALAAHHQNPLPDKPHRGLLDCWQKLQTRALTDGDWATVLHGALSHFADRPEEHPLPELVQLYHQRGHGRRRAARLRAAIDQFLKLRAKGTVAHGRTGDEAHAQQLVERHLPALVEILNQLSDIWGRYQLVAVKDRAAGQVLMGVAGLQRHLDISTEWGVSEGVMLLDSSEQVALSLYPFVRYERPHPRSSQIVFVLDRISQAAEEQRYGTAHYLALPTMGVAEYRWPLPTRVGVALGRPPRPYRGLASFTEQDALVFFGREATTQEAINLLLENECVAVTGPSGVGKSSLVHAGVIHGLRRLSIDGRRRFVAAAVRPGRQPLLALAGALKTLVQQLLEVAGEELTEAHWAGHVTREELDASLQSQSTVAAAIVESIGEGLFENVSVVARRLHRLCRDVQLSPILAVDQAEELLTVCDNPQERRQCCAVLRSLDSHGALRTILALREEYLMPLARRGRLEHLCRRSVLVLDAPDAAALIDTLVRPGPLFGFQFDVALAKEMVAEVSGTPAALPLLQFCADKFWQALQARWSVMDPEHGRAISRATVADFGGVVATLAETAEQVLAGLLPQHRSVCKTLLLELTTPSGTRLPVSKTELLERASESRDVDFVLRRLVDAHLVVARQDEEGATVVELVHEALIDHWQRLRDWVTQEQTNLKLRADLTVAARTWDENGRPEDMLWGASALEALGLDDAESNRLLSREREFIEAGRALRRRAARRRNVVVGVVAAILSGFGGLVAYQGSVAATRLEKVQMLSDIQALQDLRRERDELWPARSQQIPAMEDWLEQARMLTSPARLIALQQRMVELRAKLSDATLPAEQRQVLTWEQTTLSSLLDGLETLSDSALPDLEGRLEFARSVHRLTVTQHADSWVQVAADVAADPRFPGFILPPQEGLIPLGRDPASGLWEFCLLAPEQPDSFCPTERDARGRLVITPASRMVLILLPGGTVRVGATSDPTRAPHIHPDPDANPGEHGRYDTTRLDPFFMSKYEMTQSQWERIRGTNPSTCSSVPNQACGSRVANGAHPVETVSWVETSRLLDQLGLGLPTEAQWEYAARAGTTTPWHSGGSVESVQPYANLADATCKTSGPKDWIYEAWADEHYSHAPVGTFEPNSFGLHDTIGNVYEWCRDWYGSYDDYPLRPGDGLRLVPAGKATVKIRRGGSWYNAARGSRSSKRHTAHPSERGYYLGVRPVRAVEGLSGGSSAERSHTVR